MAVGGQRRHIPVGPAHKGEADRQHGGCDQSSAGEHGMDQRPCHPPVAVVEWLDGLELGVDEPSLDQRWVSVA